MIKLILSFLLVGLITSSAIADHKPSPPVSPKTLANKPVACQLVTENDLVDYLESEHMYPLAGGPGFALANLEGQYKQSLFFLYVNEEGMFTIIEVTSNQVCLLGHGRGISYDASQLKNILGMLKNKKKEKPDGPN